jgi:threonine dehydratase
MNNGAAQRIERSGKVFVLGVQEAREYLRAYFAPTPLILARSLGSRCGFNIYLKLESSLPTGSFKIRGALFALQSRLAATPFREVVTSSTGNHGAAVAYAARELGVHATIFLPANPSAVKRARIAALGATIFETGIDLTDAATAAVQYAVSRGAYLLDDASDAHVPMATATIACEIFEQLASVQTIYVPVGDTALIRGLAAVAQARSPRSTIVGVQAARAPSYYDSWKAGEVRPSNRCDTIADGLATRRPLASNVAALRQFVHEMQLVTDEEMLEAVRWLWIEEHIEAEPAGAASTAALLRRKPKNSSESVVAIVTGCNIAADVREKALSGRVAYASDFSRCSFSDCQL